MKAKKITILVITMILAVLFAVPASAQIMNGNTPSEWHGEITMMEKINLYSLVPGGCKLTDAAYVAIQLTSFDKGECGGYYRYNTDNSGWNPGFVSDANSWRYGGGVAVGVEDDGWVYIPLPNEYFTDPGNWAEVWFYHNSGPDVNNR